MTAVAITTMPTAPLTGRRSGRGRRSGPGGPLPPPPRAPVPTPLPAPGGVARKAPGTRRPRRATAAPGGRWPRHQRASPGRRTASASAAGDEGTQARTVGQDGGPAAPITDADRAGRRTGRASPETQSKHRNGSQLRKRATAFNKRLGQIHTSLS